MLPQTQQLLEEIHQNKLYDALIVQLQKDVLLANETLEIPVDVVPSTLVLLVHEHIYHLLQYKFTEYLNFLYIVDVSEEKIKKLPQDDSLVDLAEAVTFLVLQREWQKVWYKHKY